MILYSVYVYWCDLQIKPVLVTTTAVGGANTLCMYAHIYTCICRDPMSVESPASQFYSSPWAVGSVKSGQSSQTRPRSVSEVAEGPVLKKPKIEG